MSRALRAVSGPADAVAAAEEAVRAEADALSSAKAEEAAALKAYDQDESKASDASKATRARERAERRHATALDGLKAAVAARDDAQRAADSVEMNDAIASVLDLPSKLAPHLRALVALDRQASEIVDQIADLVIDGQDTFARATELAERLEQPATVQRQIGKPSLAQAALLARIAIARDRKERGRDIANGWTEAALEPAPTSPERPAYDAALALVTSMEKKS